LLTERLDDEDLNRPGHPHHHRPQALDLKVMNFAGGKGRHRLERHLVVPEQRFGSRQQWVIFAFAPQGTDSVTTEAHTRCGQAVAAGRLKALSAGKGIPIDSSIHDWRYWDPHQWGSHLFGPNRYPEPAATMRQGNFPGMLKKRTFHVVRVSPDHGAGIEPTKAVDAVAPYDGKAATISARD
jgi:hypothetical protein